MQNLLRQLQAKSSYARKTVTSFQDIIQKGAENFSVQRLTSHDDSQLKQVSELLSHIFEEEMDDLEKIMNEWIFDSSVGYFTISNSWGKVIGAANSSILPLESAESDRILAVWYVAVDKEYRGRRLVNELYQSMYQFALDRAEAENGMVKAIVGEASHKEIGTIERVLNREEIARKRVYCQDAKGLMKEIPYVSPPLKWDFTTGFPAEEAQSNHLMIKLVNGEQRMPASELLQMIAAIYKDSYFQPREDFSNKQAYVEARMRVHEYFAAIQTALADAKHGEVFLR